MNWHSLAAEAEYLQKCRMDEAREERLANAMRGRLKQIRVSRALGKDEGRQAEDDDRRGVLPTGEHGCVVNR
jgi:hypothetical protein